MKRAKTSSPEKPISTGPVTTAAASKRPRRNIVNPTAPIIPNSSTSPKPYEEPLKPEIENNLIADMQKLNIASEPINPSSVSEQTPLEVPVKLFEKMEDNKLKLLNALDSFHDFGKGSRSSSVTSVFVSNVITSFLENKVLKEFKSHKIKAKLEQVIYAKYVTARDSNIIEFAVLPLNRGIENTGGGREEDKIEVLSDIAEHYKLDKRNIVIVRDHGENIGCRNELKNKHLESYASWFDNGSLTVCPDYSTTNIKLTEERIVSKKTCDLFYIDELGGKYENNTYTGHIKFINDDRRPFSQEGQYYCRPTVPQFANLLETIESNKLENTKTWEIGIKWFDEQINEIYKQSQDDPVKAVNNSCMFLMDLKRAGDGLQIETAKHTIEGKIPIFVTLDLIAATISANKGIRTILTKVDNKTSLKYAHLLGHVSLQGMRAPVIQEQIVRKQKVQPDLQKELNDLLHNITKPDYEGNISNAAKFTKMLTAITPKFNDKQLIAVNDHFNIFFRSINTYMTENTSNIMKTYLQHVIDLATKYIKDKDLFSLFGTLYINIFNIYEIIYYIRAANTSQPKKFRMVLTKIQKDIIIANYINNIFKDNYELYENIIGSPTEIRKNELNYVVISPMGTIYMEYLLLNTNIDAFTKEISDLAPNFLKQSDCERMVEVNRKTDKIYPIILNFINDTKDPNIRKRKLKNIVDNIPPGKDVSLTPIGAISSTKADPLIDLQNFKNRIFKSHVTYMNAIVPLRSTETIGGNNMSFQTIKNSYTYYSYNSTLTDLYNFMKLPFQVKHMIIQYSEDKEKIIKHVFNTLYKSNDLKSKDIELELELELTVIKHCKKILNIPLEQPIKSSDNKAFLLFREILYFQPEYIDPFMLIYMTYSNSPVPPNIAFQSIPINTPTPQSRPQSRQTPTPQSRPRSRQTPTPQSIPQSRQTPTPQSTPQSTPKPQSRPQSRQTPTPQSSPVPVTRKSGPDISRRPSALRKLIVAGGKKK